MNPTARQIAGFSSVRRKVPNAERQRKKLRADALRKLDAPDERFKIAGCPKCPAWFPSVEARNLHRASEHAVGAARQAQIAAECAADEVDSYANVSKALSEGCI